MVTFWAIATPYGGLKLQAFRNQVFNILPMDHGWIDGDTYRSERSLSPGKFNLASDLGTLEVGRDVELEDVFECLFGRIAIQVSDQPREEDRW